MPLHPLTNFESKYIKMYCNVCNKYGKAQKS